MPDAQYGDLCTIPCSGKVQKRVLYL